MNNNLFRKLRNDNTALKVPFILITVIFNLEYNHYLERIIEFSTFQENTHWAERCMFKKRHIKIDFICSIQPLSIIKTHLLYHLKDYLTNKAIIITNTAIKVIYLQNKIDLWLNIRNTILDDAVLVMNCFILTIKILITNYI